MSMAVDQYKQWWLVVTVLIKYDIGLIWRTIPELDGGTEEKYDRPVIVASLQTEIWIWDFRNAYQFRWRNGRESRRDADWSGRDFCSFRHFLFKWNSGTN